MGISEPKKLNAQEVLEIYRTHLNPNYADFLERLNLDTTVQEAKGSIIVDSRGRSYIDFVAGYGIFNLGHNPPRLIQALKKALSSNRLWNRPFLNPSLAHLTKRLVHSTSDGLDRVFICSTGAEAIDSALKLARLSTKRTKIVAADGAFHGYTLGALSVCGIPSQRRPFGPLIPEVEYVPFGDLSALEKTVTPEVAALLLEPIQAEVGGETPPPGYLQSAREICDRTGALLMVDEVRTAMGRTGPFLAVQKEEVEPDILAIGKSLAGGIVPIGAILAKSSLWGRFGLSFSMSASSFAGNRLACVAAIEALEIFDDERILEQGGETGAFLWSGVQNLPALYPDLVERISGRGMLIGIHFKNSKQAGEVIRRAISDGLLVAAAFCNNRCLLIEPPLILDRAQAKRGLKILHNACEVARESFS